MTSEIVVSSGAFNHCSSICQHGTGYFLAYYSGSNECSDDQSVYLTYIKDHNRLDTIKIGDGTGNPVLWESEHNTVIMLYSKFEDSGPITRLADRWKYCSLWVQTFSFANEKIYWTSIPYKISNGNDNLLGRCKPIKSSKDGLTYLPLYNELSRHNVIYTGKFYDYSMKCSFGYDMIQPTIWEQFGGMHSLSRNFTGDGRQQPLYVTLRYSHTDQNGIWTTPIPTTINNNNSSLQVFSHKADYYIIYNNTVSNTRRLLTLGKLNDDLTVDTKAVISGSYGAYPSYCTMGDKIYISYTNEHRQITVTTIDDI